MSPEEPLPAVQSRVSSPNPFHAEASEVGGETRMGRSHGLIKQVRHTIHRISAFSMPSIWLWLNYTPPHPLIMDHVKSKKHKNKYTCGSTVNFWVEFLEPHFS